MSIQEVGVDHDAAFAKINAAKAAAKLAASAAGIKDGVPAPTAAEKGKEYADKLGALKSKIKADEKLTTSEKKTLAGFQAREGVALTEPTALSTAERAVVEAFNGLQRKGEADKKAADAMAEKVKKAAEKAAAETEKKLKNEKALKEKKATEEKAAKEKAAKDKADTAALERDAKEINVRLEKATKLDKESDDHRLAAALKLAEAKKLCVELGVPFQKWYEENVTTLGWESGRKLAAIGAAEDPVLALADMRGKNKEANKKLRDEKKAAEEAEQNRRNGGEGSVEDEGEEGSEEEAEVPAVKLKDMKKAFGLMVAPDQMKFLEWAAKEVGAKIEFSI